MSSSITVDPEFKRLLFPLSDEERSTLESSIVDDGVCRDALVIWNGIILDGHNRYEICQRHGIDFKTIPAPVYVRTREDAADWIDKNQAGRRNLTPDQASLVRGRRYNRTKKGVGKPAGTILAQNDPISTAARLATEHGVDART